MIKIIYMKATMELTFGYPEPKSSVIKRLYFNGREITYIKHNSSTIVSYLYFKENFIGRTYTKENI